MLIIHGMHCAYLLKMYLPISTICLLERQELELELYFLFIFRTNIVLIHICDDPRHTMAPSQGQEQKGKVELDSYLFECVFVTSGHMHLYLY